MVDVADPPAEIAPGPPAIAPAPPAVIAPAAPPPAPMQGPPSLVTATALGKGNYGMTLGGGYATILPLFVFEAGYGIARRLDVAFRYETVSGLFHYPQLALRWSFYDTGPWTFGARLGANYSLFAVDSDQTNLTSTIYLSGEVLVSRRVSRSTDVLGGFRTDFDLWQLRHVELHRRAEGTYRFDAAVFRVGARTQATTDLGVYVIGNLRVPIETFTYRAAQFYVLPSVEVGGTFVW